MRLIIRGKIKKGKDKRLGQFKRASGRRKSQELDLDEAWLLLITNRLVALRLFSKIARMLSLNALTVKLVNLGLMIGSSTAV